MKDQIPVVVAQAINYKEILLYVMTFVVAFIVWSFKGILKITFDNRDKLKDGFFEMKAISKDVVEVKELSKDNHVRLDKCVLKQKDINSDVHVLKTDVSILKSKI